MFKTKLNDEELHDLELMEEFTFVVEKDNTADENDSEENHKDNKEK